MPATIALKRLQAPIDASRWIVGIVASSSIVLFAVLGSTVVPAALGIPMAGTAVPTAPFLLSIALLALAWRRSIDLKLLAAARVEAEERAMALTYKDEVTGLFNRRFLGEKLYSKEARGKLTLILLDLDHFKKVNDLYGHASGDELLFQISTRMREIAGGSAWCVRLGGDEFALLLTDRSATTEQASDLAERLLVGLNKPFQLSTCVTTISASIGLAAWEGETETAQLLLRRSDIAMYEAKRLGRNRCVWFNAEMEQKFNERNLVEAEMRTSLTAGHFVPYFQPMLELESGLVTGFEVLARWNHPTRGLVEPGDFIPVAEATGMITDLSLSVMRAALVRALKWPAHVKIAVNISPVQFKDSLLSQRIIQLLTEVGFPAGRLELEISESAILEDQDVAFGTVESLKNYGIRISLDDFGKGYASLSQLRELPFDRIKIDKSFVASLLDDNQSNAIVHAIATLGRSLHLPITAEGVETESVHARLKELGCSDAQGWLFGRAISGNEAAEKFFDLALEEFPVGTQPSLEANHSRRRDHLRRGAK